MSVMNVAFKWLSLQMIRCWHASDVPRLASLQVPMHGIRPWMPTLLLSTLIKNLAFSNGSKWCKPKNRATLKKASWRHWPCSSLKRNRPDSKILKFWKFCMRTIWKMDPFKTLYRLSTDSSAKFKPLGLPRHHFHLKPRCWLSTIFAFAIRSKASIIQKRASTRNELPKSRVFWLASCPNDSVHIRKSTFANCSWLLRQFTIAFARAVNPIGRVGSPTFCDACLSCSDGTKLPLIFRRALPIGVLSEKSSAVKCGLFSGGSFVLPRAL